MAIAIRPAGAADVAAIDGLLRTSFAEPAEADLVRELCIAGDMVLTLVADDEDSGAIVGAIVFSRMEVTVGGQAVPAVALAPLAVAPAYRRQGVADALVHAAHERLESVGVVLSFVLGDPEFYGRFGYDPAVARNFDSPYSGEYFMALPLQGGLVPCGVREAARHAPAFSRLGAA
ncbi:N-acetyltransferase [Sphingomonas sp. IC-11]|uniref:GNAT family N-acetyltransferase n=1 Tax=Sphingomonas sp. IC-11 TaxID=2898528 RepID=UPI001E4A4BCE|nr:N-acetyltransferase [Sphingomonas sp. IC-11]MCD2317489.1 N-acetyltransferase [Sphingomonas sp. IC-11]